MAVCLPSRNTNVPLPSQKIMSHIMKFPLNSCTEQGKLVKKELPTLALERRRYPHDPGETGRWGAETISHGHYKNVGGFASVMSRNIPDKEIFVELLLLSYGKCKKKSNGAKGMQQSSGHIADIKGIKGAMAAVGVYVEEGRCNRDAIEEMSRIQLNSLEVPAICVVSRAFGHDIHTCHVPRTHSAVESGDNLFESLPEEKMELAFISPM
ncbi:uncharacterized protein TNCV_3157551 [Trichonephila clavipes]|nr:uncharacterized protein TNCV_3157551 [Trichonephila clavipes]